MSEILNPTKFVIEPIYARKIHEGAINMATGEPWKLDDVPTRWREATARELEKFEEQSGVEINSEM